MGYTCGLNRGGISNHPLKSVYYNMLARCNNKNYWKYDRYGGRGIRVCSRWDGKDGFINFINDMGERPTPKHQLDRIDTNRNYEPSNCRWVTKYEQMANISTNNDFVGVGWHKQRQKWRARIKVNGKDISLGLYKDKQEAIKARQSYYDSNYRT